jgi:hypothetical protein
MKKEHKELVIELSERLEREIYLFVAKNFKGGEYLHELISFTLSASITSLFNSMIFLSSENKEINDKVKKFISDVSKYIEGLDPIINVEMVKNE